MNKETEQILSFEGWVVECYSPLEICHEDGSFATLNAAKIVIEQIVNEYKVKESQNRRYYPL